MTDLGPVVKKSVLWSSFGSGGNQLIRFAASVLLARLLEPSDYGVMVIATMFLLYGKRMSEFGFAAALIRHKEATDRHFNSVFCVNLVVYTCILGLVNLLAPQVSSFFNHPSVEHVLRVLSFSFLSTSLTSVTFARLKKEFKFREFWVASFYASVLGLACSILLAFLGFGVWSLVWGEVVTKAAEVFLSILYARWCPRLRYHHASMRETFSFGIWFFVKSQLDYACENVDFFVIGRFFGADALGIYERAFRLMSLPQRQISRPVNSILYSAFSRIQDDGERVRSVYRKSMLPLSLIVYPLLSGLAIVAPYFVVVLYGSKWSGMIIPLQVLCVAGLFRSNIGILSSLLVSHNFVKLHVRQQLLGFSILCLGCFAALPFGVNGISCIVVLHGIVMTLMLFRTAARWTSLSWGDLWFVQRHAVLASALMAASIQAMEFFILSSSSMSDPLKLIILVASGALIYVIGITAQDVPEVHALRSELLGDLRKFSGTFGLKLKKT